MNNSSSPNYTSTPFMTSTPKPPSKSQHPPHPFNPIHPSKYLSFSHLTHTHPFPFPKSHSNTISPPNTQYSHELRSCWSSTLLSTHAIPASGPLQSCLLELLSPSVTLLVPLSCNSIAVYTRTSEAPDIISSPLRVAFEILLVQSAISSSPIVEHAVCGGVVCVYLRSRWCTISNRWISFTVKVLRRSAWLSRTWPSNPRGGYTESARIWISLLLSDKSNHVLWLLRWQTQTMN